MADCESKNILLFLIPVEKREICTGTAEVRSKSTYCARIGCDQWHYWCQACLEDEKRDHPGSIYAEEALPTGELNTSV